MAQLENNKVIKATKWSAITEIVTKLVNPITQMVLARLLAPEAFGVVATVVMIVTFAEIFTDAGFQKYLIQHEFKDQQDRNQCTNVAFWSNLAMSLVIWFFIYLFNDSLAKLVGNPGLGYVIVIASISIPLEAFSSIQMALYKRDFDFKTLFKARVIGVLIPLFVTIPLAFWLRSFWAIVIGTIVANLLNAVVLTIFSKWKPQFYISFAQLKDMLSFSIWSMVEAVSIWLTGYVDVFIVGVALNQYYLGLYKTSTSVVAQITAVITAVTTPILFSALSRLQSNRQEFESLFFKFQKVVGLLIIPIGFVIYCYRDFITVVLLGEQWGDAALFIGLWGLTSAVTIVLAHYSSEVYRSLGKPKISVLAQWLHIVVLWPAVIFSVKYGFETLCIARSIVRLELVLVQLVLMYIFIKLSPLSMILNVWHSVFAAVIMSLTAYLLALFGDSFIWTCFSIIICGIVYIASVSLFHDERQIIRDFIERGMKREK